MTSERMKGAQERGSDPFDVLEHQLFREGGESTTRSSTNGGRWQAALDGGVGERGRKNESLHDESHLGPETSSQLQHSTAQHSTAVGTSAEPSPELLGELAS